MGAGMKRPPQGSLEWAVRVCIDALGVEVCAELCEVTAQNVYRWADPDNPAQCPPRHALVLDRHCWLREGMAPFREVFEANAGEPMQDRVARQLQRLAAQLKGESAAA